ncbi:hypothetical protein [Methanimicrococcus hongohii]|uniref:hypothetical protein n=1 Tax=Methanimicrococcus hongohii TaxID=3028295 RepID=UPI0029311098|nr:hypothetical protein [Methanimicrococcus sp. Hf6]
MECVFRFEGENSFRFAVGGRFALCGRGGVCLQWEGGFCFAVGGRFALPLSPAHPFAFANGTGAAGSLFRLSAAVRRARIAPFFKIIQTHSLFLFHFCCSCPPRVSCSIFIQQF